MENNHIIINIVYLVVFYENFEVLFLCVFVSDIKKEAEHIDVILTPFLNFVFLLPICLLALLVKMLCMCKSL